MSASLYLEHLSDGDLTLLAQVAGLTTPGNLLEHLRADPGALETVLRHRALYAALFAAEGSDAFLRASPFLVFAVLVHRAGLELEETRFVHEWVGPGRRIPMFEVEALQRFMDDPSRRLFLAELLASYTHVASGSFWMQTRRGWRRRRYSELDPLRMVELLDSLPESDRPVLYRRLGDLTLFLTGVFPDYAGRRFLMPVARQRLERALSGGRARPESADSIWLLEELGRRSYHLAWQATESIGGRRVAVLGDVAQGFGAARRSLNFLTDRYLFPHRERWFPVV